MIEKYDPLQDLNVIGLAENDDQLLYPSHP